LFFWTSLALPTLRGDFQGRGRNSPAENFSCRGNLFSGKAEERIGLEKERIGKAEEYLGKAEEKIGLNYLPPGLFFFRLA